jgi:ethanolamine utilization protein EutP (predicted NTPase)
MIPLITFLLKSGDANLENAAACAASRIGSAQAAELVPALAEIARREGSQEASSAVFALGRIPTPEAVSALSSLVVQWQNHNGIIKDIVPALGRHGGAAETALAALRSAENVFFEPTLWSDQLQSPVAVDLSAMRLQAADHPEDLFQHQHLVVSDEPGLAVRTKVDLKDAEVRVQLGLEIFNLPGEKSKRVVVLSANSEVSLRHLEYYVEDLSTALKTVYSLAPHQTTWVIRTLPLPDLTQFAPQELHRVELVFDSRRGVFYSPFYSPIKSLPALFAALLKDGA